jgi:glucose-6-phosphate isomerase
MNSLTSWQKYKNNLYSNEALGFYLDLSDTGITETDRSNVVPLFNKALEAMGALEKGAIANPDENRQVGHYCLRDPGLAPSYEIRTQVMVSVLTFWTIPILMVLIIL